MLCTVASGIMLLEHHLPQKPLKPFPSLYLFIFNEVLFQINFPKNDSLLGNDCIFLPLYVVQDSGGD